MHNSYNYSGFVDLYRSLSQQQTPKPRAAGTRQPAQRLAAEPHGAPAQQTGAAHRQRLRLVSG